MSEMYSFEDYCKIVDALRDENGCPWDRQQTHASLKPCIINETAETIAAINYYEKTGDAENFCEELGDMLLQIVLQSRIADEEGLFSIQDVIQKASEKMIRRHPHVFGDKSIELAGAVAKEWEEIKRLEKAGMSDEEKKNREQEVLLAWREMDAHFKKALDKMADRDYK